MADDEIDLGPCCQCGRHDGVANIVMLPWRAPVPGTGWGCVVCGLPPDGAIAVLCDRCASSLAQAAERDEYGEIGQACHGYPGEGRRISVVWLTASGPFEHDLAKHEAADMVRAHGLPEHHRMDRRLVESRPRARPRDRQGRLALRA